MKILYVLDTQDHAVFEMSELPDSFEILRKDKTPIMFKPVTLQIQDLYTRLNETETLLKDAGNLLISAAPRTRNNLKTAIDGYFNKYIQ